MASLPLWQVPVGWPNGTWIAIALLPSLLLGLLSISLPMQGAGRADYYINLAREDYYAGTFEEPGRWFGQGAQWLALRDPVERETFHYLLAGFMPDGRQKLVQNAGAKDRQTGWDLTFSAPKSVSVYWATIPEPTRQVVEDAQRHAVEKALRYLEQTAGITRRGKGGAIKEKAALTFALFQHGSSRALDPQLHTHAVLINLGLRRDGTAGTLQSLNFFRAKMAVGALYQNELAAQLRGRLGLTIEPAESGFRIVGVPEELCRTFSQRRQAIEALLQKQDEHGAVAAKQAALRTRPRKQPVRRAELFAAWQQVAAEHGWTAAEALRLTQSAGERVHSPNPSRDDAQEEAHPQHVLGPSATAARSEPNREQAEERTKVEERAQAQEQAKAEQHTQAEDERKAQQQAQAEDHTRTKERSKKSEREKTKERARSEHRGQKGDQTGADHADEARQAQRGKPFRSKTPFVRVEWRRLFPRAPFWSPARHWKAPVIVIGRRGRRIPPARWGKTLWRKDLGLGELRVQQRRLFPQAPGWSPARQWTLPAFRIVPKPPPIPQAHQAQQTQRSH
ncbi:MAG: relaxase domain-containing protein [Verrucomicrobia bacterium]|nr:relaxase domain-containing protein [Verrucomicrobiota bacterium]